MICPLRNADCLRGGCQWWDILNDDCVMGHFKRQFPRAGKRKRPKGVVYKYECPHCGSLEKYRQLGEKPTSTRCKHCKEYVVFRGKHKGVVLVKEKEALSEEGQLKEGSANAKTL